MFVQCECRNPQQLQSSGSSRYTAADNYATLNLETTEPHPQYNVIQLDPRHGRPESDIDLNEYAEPDMPAYVYVTFKFNFNRQRLRDSLTITTWSWFIRFYERFFYFELWQTLTFLVNAHFRFTFKRHRTRKIWIRGTLPPRKSRLRSTIYII